MKDIQARENNTTEKIRQAANMGICLWTCRWTCRESRSKAIDIDQNWGFDIILAGEQTEERDELADGEAAFSSIACIANKLAAITIQEKLADRGGRCRFRFECLLEEGTNVWAD